MKNKANRRSFLKSIGATGIMAALFPVGILNASEKKEEIETTNFEKDSLDNKPNKRKYNSTFTNENLSRIAFPLGGIGAGMICMEGSGAFSHLSIKHAPDVWNEPELFAAISIKGLTNGAKVLEGPVPGWKKFGRKDSSSGGYEGSTAGLPRFTKVEFSSKFPFCDLNLSHEQMPISVKISGWSPFIPTDEDNSSLPVAAIEYSFVNTSSKTIAAVFSFNSKNIFKTKTNKNSIASTKNGFILKGNGTIEKPLQTDMAFFTNDDATVVNHCWFRGKWYDPRTMAWNIVENADVKALPHIDADAPGASLYVPFSLAPNQEKKIKLMIAWYVPESYIIEGEIGEPKKNCNPENGCCNSPADIGLDKYDKDFKSKYYKPWYSSKFANINDVISYWSIQYDDFKKKSTLFQEAFYASTLPAEVVEAVASNLSILKSPTVMRQYDGRMWNWEGCADDHGNSHGSCTHVWNYAQAIPHLFPALERSLRATEFCESQAADGHQNFRSNVPITPATHTFHAAADGQLGGIMKVYREWRISGDNEWLRKMYPMVKTSLDYCIKTWDPREKGVIEEPHHNTYDIEFWGADGMHSSFYIGALNAFIIMGDYLKKDVKKYKKLAILGKQKMETDLYNGEFFIQKIQTSGLNANDPTMAKSYGGEYSEEAKELLKKEGPKYQYGIGCLSDGVLGTWIARMCGLNDSIDIDKIKSHLKAVHKYNLKTDLSDHANPQRPNYAIGNEGGLLLCTWPNGGKLSLPFVYSDEVWTGIEHQVASHLMLMGNVNEGLEIVRISRDRYDGRVRNPYSEYEWGQWYGRALASYGYLQALTGVRYDAVDKMLFIDSKVGNFTSFLSTETGFGTVTLRDNKVSVNTVFGAIDIQKINHSGKINEYIKG